MEYFRTESMIYISYYDYYSGLETAFPYTPFMASFCYPFYLLIMARPGDRLAYWNLQSHYIPRQLIWRIIIAIGLDPYGFGIHKRPKPPTGIVSSRLLRGEGNIEGVLRAVLRAQIISHRIYASSLLAPLMRNFNTGNSQQWRRHDPRGGSPSGD
jgi:hypothetical protein